MSSVQMYRVEYPYRPFPRETSILCSRDGIWRVEENAFTVSFKPFGGTPPLFEQSTLNDFLLYLTLLNTTHVGSKFF